MSVAIGRIAGIVMAPASSGARSALHAKGLAGAISATGGDIELRTLPGRRKKTPPEGRGQGPHSTATALPAPGPAIHPSAAGIVFAVCSFAVAMLSWRRGDGHTGHRGHWGTRFHWEGLKTKSEKCRKQKGAWAITGLGHGIINRCCEWRCPLYPRKQTSRT